MRLVDHEQSASRLDQPRRLFPVAGVGQDDAHVRSCRLGQHARHIAVRQLALEGSEVVELDDARRYRWVDSRPDVAGLLRRNAILERDDRLVDGAVIAVVHNQHLRPTGQLATRAQNPAIGVRSRQREGPLGQTKAPCKLACDPDRILGWQHRRDAPELANPVLHGRNHRVGRVPRHRAGVAKAEIDQLVAIDVDDAIALGPLEEDDVLADPDLHPLHRDATNQVCLRLGCECARRWRALGGDGALTFEQLVESCAIELGAFHQLLLSEGSISRVTNWLTSD